MLAVVISQSPYDTVKHLKVKSYEVKNCKKKPNKDESSYTRS
jgi:hypothetical protein